MGRSTLVNGDMMDVLAGLDASSFDSCVTDPPYELGFMKNEWDATGISFRPKTWRAVYRILKPGAHLLVFGGSRTYHRIAVAVEDAGFEIRDTICWLHNQGLPKSIDVSLAIDRAAGMEERKDRKLSPLGGNVIFRPTVEVLNRGTPNHELAAEYDGFGTALKPSFEPVIVARKPFPGKVAHNVARFGTSGLNVDACSIHDPVDNLDRFPTNTIISCECGGDAHDPFCPVHRLGDHARFFFQTKASRKERMLGIPGNKKELLNPHPTIKPLKLMRWLCVLCTPPNGLVIDPFMGSGTTGMAAVAEGFRFFGCELDKTFFDVSGHRIAYAEKELSRDSR